jgi:hypothetical protein
MAITQNAVRSFGNRAVLSVLSHLWDVGKSLPMPQSYFAPDSYGNRFIYPGLIVCEDPVNEVYVPANESGSYGVYSYFTYAAGVLYTLYDTSFETQIVAPATRAAVVEQFCYVLGGTLGTVSADIKSAQGMKLIQWD